MRAANKWLLPALTRALTLPRETVRHIFLAVCDHFEPYHHTDVRGSTERLQHWARAFPALAEQFHDSDGRGPRHTFFYPIEQYDPAHVDVIGSICARTGSEIEVQLHHDADTEATLTDKLHLGITQLASHGHLSTDTEGRTRFAFVHGNWALCNSRPDGRWCGVPNELTILRRLGCYADFTFPSAPSDTQPRAVNQIGYARESSSPRALDALIPARVGAHTDLRHSPDHLLLVQGPLGLNWQRRKWGLLPRLENADLTPANPPTPDRLDLWLHQRIHVTGRPGWLFIKLHTHGAVPENAAMLLGKEMAAFHRHFTQTLPAQTGASVHYVTAREMTNLIHAAEDHTTVPPAQSLDHHFHRRLSQ